MFFYYYKFNHIYNEMGPKEPDRLKLFEDTILLIQHIMLTRIILTLLFCDSSNFYWDSIVSCAASLFVKKQLHVNKSHLTYVWINTDEEVWLWQFKRKC